MKNHKCCISASFARPCARLVNSVSQTLTKPRDFCGNFAFMISHSENRMRRERSLAATCIIFILFFSSASGDDSFCILSSTQKQRSPSVVCRRVGPEAYICGTVFYIHFRETGGGGLPGWIRQQRSVLDGILAAADAVGPVMIADSPGAVVLIDQQGETELLRRGRNQWIQL